MTSLFPFAERGLAALSLVVLAACSRGALPGDGAGGGGAGPSGAGAGSGEGSVGPSTATGPATGPSTGPGTTGSGSGPGSGPGTTGSGTASSSTGTGRVCSGFGDACTECISTSCPEVWCGCDDNQTCLQLFGCLDPCNGDTACAQDCFGQFSDGISDAYLVGDCAATACTGDCGWGTDVTPCTECLLTDCEDAMNACLAEPECLILYNCLTTCAPIDLACQQGCYDDHGSGVDSLQLVLECSTGVCADPCGQ